MSDDNQVKQNSSAPALSPHLRHGVEKVLTERRNIISSVFVAILMGIAYQEMLSPVRDTVRSNGVRWETLLLAASFFLTSMRFFIGNQLHLLSDSTVGMRGDMWLFDFLVITIQSLFLCFLGGVATPDISHNVKVDFYDIVIILYLIDIAWIISQAVIGKLFISWRRCFVPWAWAALNTMLLVGVILIRNFYNDAFSILPLSIFLAINSAAFAADMILIDYHDIV